MAMRMRESRTAFEPALRTCIGVLCLCSVEGLARAEDESRAGPAPSGDLACQVGTAFDPFSRRCLRQCGDGRLEVAVGRCCWPGQDWQGQSGRCVGPAICPAGFAVLPGNAEECVSAAAPIGAQPAGISCREGERWDGLMNRCIPLAWHCPEGQGASRDGQCVAVDGICASDDQCEAAAMCMAGRCMRSRSYGRVELSFDFIPVTTGSWEIADRVYDSDGQETTSAPFQTGSYRLGPGAGLSLRASHTLSLRWSLGGYVGYLSLPDQNVSMDSSRNRDVASRIASFRMGRTGAVVNVRWSPHRSFFLGLGAELGVAFGNITKGGEPFGFQGGSEIFVDVPMTQGSTRLYLTLSLGFCGAVMFEDGSAGGHSATREDWAVLMPVVRAGVGGGH
jgi:hypothetical protein